MDQEFKDNNLDNNELIPSGHSRKRKTVETYTDSVSDIPEAPSRARVKKKTKNVLLRRAILFAVLEIIALCGMFIFAYASKQYSKIQRPNVNQMAIKNVNLSSEQIEAIEKGYWNIAVFGVDSRNSSVGKGANSDVIMIVSINRDTGEIKLCSVYRDSYLKTGDNTYGKINGAYCTGGPEQALKALNENLDLNLTQYVTFNWRAVATGINILGGVDIELSKAEFAYINGFITETVKGTGLGSVQLTHAGMNHLDGVQAVAYARLRLMDNDYARTERQRKIIQQCFDKAKNADLQTLNDLLGNMLSMVATNMTWQDGLDAIAEVGKYSITESTGFPFARAEANMGKAGACVIPQTLESNVRDLHALLFAQEGYDPSEQVKQISATISAKTGYYNEGKKAAPVSTEGYLPAPKKESTADTSSSPESSGEKTEKDNEITEKETEVSKKKDDDLEYAISRDGYLIYVDGKDANGNKTYQYALDNNGKRIKMIDYDENGNPIYLYEVDEDGNFYLDGEVRDNTEKPGQEKETDENGNQLPGQGNDDEESIYGPGAVRKTNEDEFINGPGSASKNKKTEDENINGPGSVKQPEPKTPGDDAAVEDDEPSAGPGQTEGPGQNPAPGQSQGPAQNAGPTVNDEPELPPAAPIE